MNMNRRPPVTLSKEERKIWKLVTDELSEKNELSVLDYPSIVAYCKEMCLYYECMEKVADKGSVVKMINGKQEVEIQSPYYKNAKIALTNAKNLADRFGLNSLSRKKMNIKEEKKENDVLTAD